MKKSLLMVPMVMLLSNAAISSADASPECRDRCNQEMKACQETIGAIKPYTAEEQQQLDECANIQADCHSRCAEGTDAPAQESAKNEPTGADAGVADGSGQ